MSPSDRLHSAILSLHILTRCHNGFQSVCYIMAFPFKGRHFYLHTIVRFRVLRHISQSIILATFINNVHFYGTANPAIICTIRSSRIQLFPVTIFHSRHGLRHDTGKNFIDAFKNPTVTAKIACQIDTSFRCTGFTAIRLIFRHEQGWICQPEAIDALLDIAYHKTIRFACNERGNHFLNTVCILIFIDEDFLEVLM